MGPVSNEERAIRNLQTLVRADVKPPADVAFADASVSRSGRWDLHRMFGGDKREADVSVGSEPYVTEVASDNHDGVRAVASHGHPPSMHGTGKGTI